MLNKLSIGFAAILLLAAMSCNKQTGKSNLKLKFLPMYNNEPLVIGNKYPANNDDSVTFSNLNFFISDIRLVRSNDKMVHVHDDNAELVSFSDFTTTTLVQAQEGQSFTFDKVAEGSFKEIRIGIGVVAVLNGEDPSNYPTTSALNDVANYWTAWNSFIFSKVEGQWDTVAATNQFLSFSYHSGTENMYQDRTFTKTFTLSENATTELVFHVNAHDILFKSGAEMDMHTLSVSHGASVGTVAFTFANQSITNIANAITIQN